MSAGFGFSTGDFIAAIDLVGKVIDALRSSGNAQAEFRELVSQLLSLETALLQEKMRRFQPSLGTPRDGRTMGAREHWMRVKWALCKKGDVVRFKTDLMGHTQSILVLLAVVQRTTQTIYETRENVLQNTLAGRFQKSCFDCIERLNTVLDQGREILKFTVKIFRMNIVIFHTVLRILNILTNVPGQVERQQPIHLVDALGRHSPFHLEFIRSTEAFVSVLKSNFRKHGNATWKIEQGEFAIQDTATGRDIDLEDDWESSFCPGQRINMSLLFFKEVYSEKPSFEPLICPGCGKLAEKTGGVGFIECKSCGMEFLRELHKVVEVHIHKTLGDLGHTALKKLIPHDRRSRCKETISVQVESNYMGTKVQARIIQRPPNEDISKFQRVRVVEEYSQMYLNPVARSKTPFCVYTLDGLNSQHFEPLTIERKQIEDLYWTASKHEAITVLGDKALPLEYVKLSTIL